MPSAPYRCQYCVCTTAGEPKVSNVTFPSSGEMQTKCKVGLNCLNDGKRAARAYLIDVSLYRIDNFFFTPLTLRHLRHCLFKWETLLKPKKPVLQVEASRGRLGKGVCSSRAPSFRLPRPTRIRTTGRRHHQIGVGVDVCVGGTVCLAAYRRMSATTPERIEMPRCVFSVKLRTPLKAVTCLFNGPLRLKEHYFQTLYQK